MCSEKKIKRSNFKNLERQIARDPNESIEMHERYEKDSLKEFKRP